MKKKILIACIIILAAVFAVNLLPVHGEDEIYDSVVRLHILANSDSEEDQELKLQVRDEILLLTGEALKDCKTQSEAEQKLTEILPKINEAAEEKIRSSGYGYTVRTVIGQEDYPTRQYESCSFPAGEYLSLRVIIGKGEGQNWWCCLFPPLCLSSATDTTDNEDAFISVGLSDEQYKIITRTDSPKYKVRFKILEVIKGIFD